MPWYGPNREEGVAKSVGLGIERVLSGGVDEVGTPMVLMVEVQGAAVPVRLSLPLGMAPRLLDLVAAARAGSSSAMPAASEASRLLHPETVSVHHASRDASDGITVSIIDESAPRRHAGFVADGCSG